MKKKAPLKKKTADKPKRKTRAKADPSLNLARLIGEAAEDMKGEKTVILDLKDKSSYADYLIITSASNTRQALAMADKIQDNIHAKTKKWPLGVEGTDSALWVLIDYGDVVAHIFLEETREFYRLERLWYDAKRVKL
ncbi:MAG: ribosome silencing factor [Deltaproteobacteria bacterium]|nr:ribosome silencing factor [Deltaproteobacteria bacterium]